MFASLFKQGINNYVCCYRLFMGDSDELFARIIADLKILPAVVCSTQSMH